MGTGTFGAPGKQPSAEWLVAPSVPSYPQGVIFLHGDGGYLDELVIVVVAFVVLWVAVRLAGRGQNDESDEDGVPDAGASEDAGPLKTR